MSELSDRLRQLAAEGDEMRNDIEYHALYGVTDVLRDAATQLDKFELGAPQLFVLWEGKEADGSGNPSILGVFSEQINAEAGAWQAAQETGSLYPINITEVTLNR